MKLLGTGAFLLMTIACSVVAARPGKPAGEASVKLEVAPATLKLAPAEEGRTVLVARNSGTASVKRATLVFTSASGLKTRADVTPKDIPPGGSTAWVITVERPVDAPEGGEVTARVEYTSDSDKGTVPGIATAKLEIQGRPRPALDKMLETRVESTLKSLQHERPGIVYLIVKNKADFPVEVTVQLLEPARGTKESDPQFDATLPQPNVPIQLPAFGEHGFPVTLKAKDVVKPGKQLMAFTVTAAWQEAGKSRSAGTVAKYEFDVGVLGESELLAAVGAPSVLVLPGVLFLLTFQMLWNNLSHRPPLTVGIKDATFWVLAILLSIGTVAAYPYVTAELLKAERNLLNGYGTKDLAIVWLGSIAVAGLAWLLVATGFWAKLRVEQWLKTRSEFRAGDSPALLLTKLARNNRGMLLEQVDYGAQNPVRALLLWEDTAGHEAWIVLPLLYAWGESPDADFKRQFEEATHEEGPRGAKKLAGLIGKGAAKGLSLKWDQRGAFTSPRRVLRSEVTLLGPKQWLANPSE